MRGLLPAFALLAMACGVDSPELGQPQKIAEAPSPAGSASGTNVAKTDLHLIVTNQSFDHDPVDIDVFLNGTHVVKGGFVCENQHTYTSFDFVVTEGRHRLRATAASGSVVMEQDVDVAGELWGVLAFWYYPTTEGGVEVTPRQLDWRTYDAPPEFD